MRRLMRPKLMALVTAGLMMLLAIFGGGGKALAATVAALLSGSSSQGTRLDGIEVLSWSYDVKSPRDLASGQASGKRQYQPLLIRKRIDKASPLLYRAMGRAETFGSLKFAIKEQGVGKSSDLTVTMTNAKVVEIATGDINADGITEESVSFTFEKIEYAADGVTYQDTWSDADPTVGTAGPPTYEMAIKENGLPGKKSPVMAYQTQITSPRDPASGLPTGKRMHKPFIMVTESNVTAPELTRSFLTGKSLAEVTIAEKGWDGTVKGGLRLSGVQVVGMTETRRDFTQGHVQVGAPSRANPLFESNGGVGSNPLYEASLSPGGMACVYELVYQKIQWVDSTGGVTYEDSWDSQR